MRYPLRWFAAVLAGSWPASMVSGQCLQWDSSVQFGPTSGSTWGISTFDDGSGPVLLMKRDNQVMKWTGSSWVICGDPFDEFDAPVAALCGYDAGTGMTLYAVGPFTQLYWSGLPLRGIAKLVGSTWQPVGNGLPASSGAAKAMLAFDDGAGRKLYVGGAFDSSPGFQSDSLLTWDGAMWRDVGTGLVGVSGGLPWVNSMCEYDDGSGPALYVGGLFVGAGGVSANSIAKWDGTNWSALGSGLAGGQYPLLPMVQSLAVFDDGSGPVLYVGGVFSAAGGVPADGLARWNGTSWSAVPGVHVSPAHNQVLALAVHDDGNGQALYTSKIDLLSLGSWGGPRRWDGSTWWTLGVGSLGGDVWSLVSFDDGQGGGPALYAAGQLSTMGGNLMSWFVSRWRGCVHPIDAMCSGDGSFAPCPCANFGMALHGCGNSTSASGALLSHTGTTNPDTLMLVSSSEPSSSLSMFLQSDALRPAQVSFGDGILCLGGQLRRMYLRNAVNGTAQAPDPGDPSISQRSAALGDPISPGAVRYYQVWYRDGVASFCTQSPGSTFNISNGLRVVW